MLPGMPDKISETIYVTIGYFEPKPIKILGNALYPSI